MNIVELLYAVPETGADPELIENAADEIQRLRTENEALRSDLAKWVTDYQAQKMRNDRLEWERGNIDEVFRTVSDREIKFRNRVQELEQQIELQQRKDALLYHGVTHAHALARIAELEAFAKFSEANCVELKEKLVTQKAYYESVFEDGARRIAELTEQQDQVSEACAKLAENRKPRFSEFSTPSKDIAQEIRAGEWRKHLHLRQQIATHTASQIDRDQQVAEACAKAANEACATNRVLIAIRTEWRKYMEGRP
jgi:predicted nuclease with TOPRIM domain